MSTRTHGGTGSVGSALPVTGAPDYDALHDVLARARDEEPVFYWPALDLWVVTRHDDVLDMVRDTRRFSNVGVLGSIARSPESTRMLEDAKVPDHVTTRWVGITDGDVHDRMKATLKSTFTPRRIAHFEPRVRELAGAYIDRLPADGPYDFIDAYAFPFPLSVILALMGLELDDLDQLRTWSDHLIRYMTAPMDPEEELACARSVIALNDYCGAIIAARRRKPGEDFLSALIVEAQGDDSVWGDEELRHFISHGLLLAGHETTKAVMSGGLWRILSQPAGMQALRDDPTLIGGAVEEALRYDPPISGMFRVVTEDTTVAGVTIPAGARAYYCISSANADPARYGCPRDFMMDRPGSEQFHLTFGNGAHYCLGAPLARMEIRVTYEMLAERVPAMRLAPGHRPTYVENPLLMHLAQLWVENGT